MSIQAYIYFNGNCREAVEFYANVFQTNQPQFMLYGDFHGESDFEHNEADKKLVMHTNLIISGSMVMFSDVHSGMPFIQGNNIGLTVLSKDENEIRSVYEKLKEGGTIIMEPQETFWSKCFANVTDKYVISWQLSLESEQVK